MRRAGLVLERGWWHLNTTDAWDLLGELHTHPTSSTWQRGLLGKAQLEGLPAVIDKLTIVKLPVTKIHSDPSVVILIGTNSIDKVAPQ